MSRGDPVYDTIGVGYARVRRPDPRLARQIHDALGSARLVVNVGAGAGSYEPPDRAVVAVEPSMQMVRQRPEGTSSLVLRAIAADLPFRAGVFDASLALLTVHHWPDPVAGLEELRRVTDGPAVVFTFDPGVHASQWLVADYLPSMAALDPDLPSPQAIATVLGGGVVSTVYVPHDCIDGFCHAWWRRPEAYLDPSIRAGISGIARLPAEVVTAGMAKLADDLQSGIWYRRHRALLDQNEVDAGYRLVVSEP